MRKNYRFDSLKLELRQQRQLMHETCRQFNRAPSKGHLKKLSAQFSHCGTKTFIEHGFHCDYGKYISLGDNVYINVNCTFLDGGHIQIGDHCLIGPNVQILTINHDLSPQERLSKTNIASDVVIEENVWIGAGVIITPGVHIANGCVVGAGSLVCKDLKANTLYAGNPAQAIKSVN